MREFGCTRVELGVQLIDDRVYEFVKRGHTVKDVVEATKCLRNAGFKIGYHLMPGLPRSTPEKDLKLFKKIFSDERFKPDQIKIYPCQVLPNSELEKIYWEGKYIPYTPEEIQKLLIEMLKVIPRYCRVMRIMREIPLEYLIAGSKDIGIRKDVEEELRKEKVKLNEIRYREIGFNKEKTNLNLKLKITKYSASNGKEYFLEIINKEDILFGLLRLRIFDKKAIIRELHVYGQSLKLGEEGKESGQHTGLGKWLMSGAEKIAKKEKCKNIKVISGVGVREYYRKLGYELEKGKGKYMIKLL
jgi:elongator complex protein 3